MTPRVRHHLGAVALVSALLLLAGCAGSPDRPAQALDSLQSRVFDVTQASAQHKYSSALTLLHALQDAVTRSTKSGDISGSRAAGIQASIDLVEVDLQAAIAKSATPTPSPTATPGESTGDGSGGGSDNGNSGNNPSKGGQGNNGNKGNKGKNKGNGGSGNSGGSEPTPTASIAPSAPSEPSASPSTPPPSSEPAPTPSDG